MADNEDRRYSNQIIRSYIGTQCVAEISYLVPIPTDSEILDWLEKKAMTQPVYMDCVGDSSESPFCFRIEIGNDPHWEDTLRGAVMDAMFAETPDYQRVQNELQATEARFKAKKC